MNLYIFFFCAFPLPIFGLFLYAHRSLCEGKRGGARKGEMKGGRPYKSEEFFTTISFALVLSFAVYCSHVCIISRKNHELLADCWVYKGQRPQRGERGIIENGFPAYIDNTVNGPCRGRIQTLCQRNILARNRRRKALGLRDRSLSLYLVARQGSTLARGTRVWE